MRNVRLWVRCGPWALLFALLLLPSAWAVDPSAGAGLALKNGDSNADGVLDITDSAYLLDYLFLGGPAPVALAPCGGQPPAVENGDVNGDGARDVSDAVGLLSWLFLGAQEPAPACDVGGLTGLGAGHGEKGGDDHSKIRHVPPGKKALGLTYGEWAARWWQWVLSLPFTGHPLADETGEACDVGQSGPVWFLGGVFNESGIVTRECTVPEGMHIFFPIVNTECSTVEPPPFFGANEAELLECNDAFFSDADEVSVTLDGVTMDGLTNFRVQSPIFEFTLPDADDLLGAPGETGSSVADGYYFMLKPLKPGEHMLHFRGVMVSGPIAGFSQDITYHLTVLDDDDEDEDDSDDEPRFVAPPQAKVHGKSLGEWLETYWRWYVEGGDDTVDRVRLLGIPDGELQSGDFSPGNPAYLKGELQVELPRGTHFVLPSFAWITETYDPALGIPDDPCIPDDAMLAAVSPLEFTIDGVGIISDANKEDFYIPCTSFDPPIMYDAPTDYGSIGALQYQSVGVVGRPLPPGDHVIHLYEEYIVDDILGFSFGVIYDNTWNVHVPDDDPDDDDDDDDGD